MRVALLLELLGLAGELLLEPFDVVHQLPVSAAGSHQLQLLLGHLGHSITRYTTVFRIPDILRRIRILGSVHWVTDPQSDLETAPDPDLFVSSFRENNKNKFCLLITYCRYIYISLQR